MIYVDMSNKYKIPSSCQTSMIIIIKIYQNHSKSSHLGRTSSYKSSCHLFSQRLWRFGDVEVAATVHC